MPAKGYDDRPTILRVETMMAASPGMTRHAAIKAVVGDNWSNIRRIEQKMSQAARAAPGRVLADDQTMPPGWNSVATMGRALDAWRNPRPDFGALLASFTRGDRLAAGACATLLAVSLIGILGESAVDALLWASRLEGGIVALLGGTVPQDIALSAPHAASGFDTIHSVRSSAGAAAYPWIAGLLFGGILVVLLHQSLPYRCGWRIRLAVPGAIGSLIGLGALVPALTDFVAAFGTTLAWWAITKSHALYELPIRLPITPGWLVDHEPTSRPGIFFFGNARTEAA
jgi:hypothetical protein